MSGPDKEQGPPSTAVAFFDVDGTLLVSQSATLFIRYLWREGLIGVADLARMGWGYVTYRFGFFNLTLAADFASSLLRGLDEADIIKRCQAWYQDDVRQHYSQAVLGRLKWHQGRGDRVVLLSGASTYLCDLVSDDIHADDYIANEFEISDGVFTGRAKRPFCYGEGKLTRARQWADEKGVNLADCYYYGDSIGDLPVLSEVAYPCVVNADPRLRVEARRRGWQAIDDSTRCLPNQ